jgi:hypothetical protein
MDKPTITISETRGSPVARIMLPLMSGLAVGLALGLSAGSSSMLASTESVGKMKEEPLYQGRPAGFWIGQLEDRDPSFRRQAMWAVAHLGPGQESAARKDAQ